MGWVCDFDSVNLGFLVLILESDDIPSLSEAAEGRLTLSAVKHVFGVRLGGNIAASQLALLCAVRGFIYWKRPVKSEGGMRLADMLLSFLYTFQS